MVSGYCVSVWTSEVCVYRAGECDRDAEVLDWFYQAEDGIRDLVRARGLGDVYKRQVRASAERNSR